MPRRPKPAPRPFQIDDEFPPIEKLLTGDAAWLVPALSEGLLSHVSSPKRNTLRKNIDFTLRMFLTLVQVPSPLMPPLSEDDKRDIIEKLVTALRDGKPGKHSAHSLERMKQHAVRTEQYLQAHPFPFRAKAQANRNLWLREHLPALLKDFSQRPCHQGHCPANRTIPTLEQAKALGLDCPTPATLPRMIVGYYHGLKPETVTKLLYPGNSKVFAATMARIRGWMDDPATFHDRMKALLLS